MTKLAALALLALFALSSCKRAESDAHVSPAPSDAAAPNASSNADANASFASVGARDPSARACALDAGCPDEMLCTFHPGQCGKGKGFGVCEARPASCEGTRAPVCACDGKSYPNACAAHQAGVDLAVGGGCKKPLTGFIPCGAHYCDVETSYCEIFLSDVDAIPTNYFCRPLPSACMSSGGGGVTCDCFPKDTRCLPFCGPLPTVPGGKTGFHLTCQGRRPPDP